MEVIICVADIVSAAIASVERVIEPFSMVAVCFTE